MTGYQRQAFLSILPQTIPRMLSLDDPSLGKELDRLLRWRLPKPVSDSRRLEQAGAAGEESTCCVCEFAFYSRLRDGVIQQALLDTVLESDRTASPQKEALLGRTMKPLLVGEKSLPALPKYSLNPAFKTCQGRFKRAMASVKSDLVQVHFRPGEVC